MVIRTQIEGRERLPEHRTGESALVAGEDRERDHQLPALAPRPGRPLVRPGPRILPGARAPRSRSRPPARLRSRFSLPCGLPPRGSGRCGPGSRGPDRILPPRLYRAEVAHVVFPIKTRLDSRRLHRVFRIQQRKEVEVDQGLRPDPALGRPDAARSGSPDHAAEDDRGRSDRPRARAPNARRPTPRRRPANPAPGRARRTAPTTRSASRADAPIQNTSTATTTTSPRSRAGDGSRPRQSATISRPGRRPPTRGATRPARSW